MDDPTIGNLTFEERVMFVLGQIRSTQDNQLALIADTRTYLERELSEIKGDLRQLHTDIFEKLDKAHEDIENVEDVTDDLNAFKKQLQWSGGFISAVVSTACYWLLAFCKHN
jgi:SMC interacting uncharacterized protein involved in chromosome segregation